MTEPERQYFLVWVDLAGDLKFAGYTSTEALAGALADLRRSGHPDHACEALVFHGTRLRLSRSPRCLMLPTGAVPLYDADAAREPDDGLGIAD